MDTRSPAEKVPSALALEDATMPCLQHGHVLKPLVIIADDQLAPG